VGFTPNHGIKQQTTPELQRRQIKSGVTDGACALHPQTAPSRSSLVTLRPEPGYPQAPTSSPSGLRLVTLRLDLRVCGLHTQPWRRTTSSTEVTKTPDQVWRDRWGVRPHPHPHSPSPVRPRLSLTLSLYLAPRIACHPFFFRSPRMWRDWLVAAGCGQACAKDRGALITRQRA
jgi:hypothetical protein